MAKLGVLTQKEKDKINADPSNNHEALDRADSVGRIHDDMLVNHNYIQANPDLLKLAEKIADDLGKLYQMIGQKKVPNAKK